MASENPLPFDPNRASDLIKQGRLKIVTIPVVLPVSAAIAPAYEQVRRPDQMMEKAKDMLGTDFLGPEAVVDMQDKLRAVGVNVEFNLDILPPLVCTEKDLQLAKENGEMLVLRVKSAKIDGVSQALTIMNFRELFKQDPRHSLATPFYSFRQDANDWYPSENFANDPAEMEYDWRFVKKELTRGSTSKKWDEQENILREYGEDMDKKGASRSTVWRRSAMEAIWDTMLYYTSTGQRLLDGKLDWTKSRASGGHLVYVGRFGSDGLRVGRWRPGRSRGDLGVCPSR